MSQNSYVSYKELDKMSQVVALDYQGTKKLFLKMISEWKEAAGGEDLYEIETSVGWLLCDFGHILGMPSDELNSLLL